MIIKDKHGPEAWQKDTGTTDSEENNTLNTLINEPEKLEKKSKKRKRKSKNKLESSEEFSLQEVSHAKHLLKDYFRHMQNYKSAYL